MTNKPICIYPGNCADGFRIPHEAAKGLIV